MQHPTISATVYPRTLIRLAERAPMLEQHVTSLGLQVYEVIQVVTKDDHALAQLKDTVSPVAPYMLHYEDHLTLVTHGSEEGAIWAKPEWLNVVDQIVCCFPARVKARIPSIAAKVWGDWDTITGVGAKGGWLKFAPEEYWPVPKETK